MLHIYVQKGAAAPQLLADYVIPAQGHVQFMDLGEHLRGDWNGDMKVAVDDFAHMAACLEGPATAAQGQCLGVFDFDGNSHVDLADCAAFQEAFTGD